MEAPAVVTKLVETQFDARGRMKTTFGTLSYDEKKGSWTIEASPDVLMRFKSVFPRAYQGFTGTLSLIDNPEVCKDLAWFMERYPLRVANPKRLKRGVRRYDDSRNVLESVLIGRSTGIPHNMALPPRDYQMTAAELTLSQGFLLLADQMGLGKTVTALTVISGATHLTGPIEGRPAVVVCAPHLCRQWQAFAGQFLPLANTHIVKTRAVYDIPDGTDIIIVSYSKIASWADHLAGCGVGVVVFDEVQEVRRLESAKHNGCRRLANKSVIRMGLSGTPVVNYGGEIYNIFECLCPGKLGSHTEFVREWCVSKGNHFIISNPDAFGAYLRREGLMLRRTRIDVGRELPELSSYIQSVPHDMKILDKIKTDATELARTILKGNFGESGQASRLFDMKLRQATGLSKAHYVGHFVKMLIEDGQKKVILAGWHRSVYDIWHEVLEEFPRYMFTGTESPAAKSESFKGFRESEEGILIMSLGSGAGLDGLQDVCNTVVFGELGWSRAIHGQIITRAHRDGQKEPCTAYYLVSEGGSDPFMCEVLGVKSEQARGIVDPGSEKTAMAGIDPDRIKEMARKYLES